MLFQMFYPSSMHIVCILPSPKVPLPLSILLSLNSSRRLVKLTRIQMGFHTPRKMLAIYIILRRKLLPYHPRLFLFSLSLLRLRNRLIRFTLIVHMRRVSSIIYFVVFFVLILLLRILRIASIVLAIRVLSEFFFDFLFHFSY